ncbi:MAG TPA: hypothetical protein VFU73_12220 [Actinocrinis sp.]|nr:hypothetical protein [Actinocrinis sp.]
MRAARRALALIALAGALFAAAAAPATAAASTASANAASSNAASSNAATSNTAAVPPVAKPAPAPPAGVAVGRQYVPKMDSAPQGTVSPLVTWSVTLTASPTELWPTQYTTLTAKANHTVSGTIYYIDILDDSNTILAACGAGTTCSVAVTSLTPGIVDYTAYISNSPTDVTGSHYVTYSGGEDVDWFGDDIALTASKYTVAVGTSVVLKEKASSDIGSTPFYVQLWDTTDGTLLNQCATGTTCSATVSQSAATTHSYVATFAGYATSYPPPIPQGASAVNYITWSASGIQVSLTAPAVTVNGPETVTATSTVNVGSTPYYIEIFDENGTRIAACGTGTTCSVSYTPSGRGSNLIAFVSGYSSALPPTSIQASSNAVHTVYERLT